MPVVYFPYCHCTNQFSCSVNASRTETLVDYSFGYLDKENVIKWNSTNALTYLGFADPVTNSTMFQINFPTRLAMWLTKFQIKFFSDS